MGDIYDKGQDTLEQIANNIIDVESAVGTTNELLGKILEVLTPKEVERKSVTFTSYDLPVQQATVIKEGTILTDAYGNEFYVGRDNKTLYPEYNRDETKELGDLREKVKKQEAQMRWAIDHCLICSPKPGSPTLCPSCTMLQCGYAPGSKEEYAEFLKSR